MAEFFYRVDDNVSLSLVSPDFPEDVDWMKTTLSVLQRNLDDFYLVTFTVITFGWIPVKLYNLRYIRTGHLSLDLVNYLVFNFKCLVIISEN